MYVFIFSRQVKIINSYKMHIFDHGNALNMKINSCNATPYILQDSENVITKYKQHNTCWLFSNLYIYNYTDNSDNNQSSVCGKLNI